MRSKPRSKTPSASRAHTPLALPPLQRSKTPPANFPSNNIFSQQQASQKTYSTITYDTPHDTPYQTARIKIIPASRAQSRMASRPATTTPAPRVASPPKKHIKSSYGNVAAEPQVIHLHVGQAGTMIGYSMWEMFCQEWGIQGDGTCKYDHAKRDNKNRIGSFFHETKSGKCIPRCLFIDSERDSHDELLTKEYATVFGSDALHCSKQATDACFYKGYESSWYNLEYNDAVRKQMEQCDAVQGVICSNASAGGASGLVARITQSNKDLFAFKNQLLYTVLPSQETSLHGMETYNTVLSLAQVMPFVDAVLPFSNANLVALCKKHHVDSTLNNTNYLISNMLSSLTSSWRFGGAPNANLSELIANLVPIPSCKLISCSFAPIFHATADDQKQSIHELVSHILTPQSHYFAPFSEHSLACYLQLRGEFPTPESYQFNQDMKKGKLYHQLHAASKNKHAITVQTAPIISNAPFAHASRDALLLHNSATCIEPLQHLILQFDKQMQGKMYLHKYMQEGATDMTFHDARQYLLSIIDEYKNN